MKTAPTSTNTTARWRHVMVGASAHGDHGIHPVGTHPVGTHLATTGSPYPKSFTSTTKRRATRRGAPPH